MHDTALPRRLPAGARFRALAVTAAALALPCLAWAHHFMDDRLPQTLTQGLLSGLGHPVIGVDHAAFIVAAGFLLAPIKGGPWGVLALILGSLLGAALHLAGFSLPAGEAAVALSVILAGGLVMSARRVALPWMAGGLALAGLLHGHAYAEAIFGAEPAPLAAYLAGFTFMQLGVATAVLLAHRRLIATGGSRARPVSSALGAAVGAIGVLFLAGNVVA
jgi:urease accessory protein